MYKVSLAWEAARPKTLIAGIAPVAVGSALSYAHGAFRLSVFFFALLFAIAIQIGTNLANDYFDCIQGADTKERKGPRRLTQAGVIKPINMLLAAMVTFTCAGLASLYLIWVGGMGIALLAALAILLGFLYTATPYSIAYLGLGDLFVLFFFGPVATCGAFYLQTHNLSWDSALAGLGIGFLSTAILIANNLRDEKEDREAGKKTLVARFGKTFGEFEYLACLFCASLIPLFLFWSHQASPLILIATAAPLFASYRLYPALRQKRDAELNFLLPQTGQVLTIYTILMTLGALFS